VAASGCALPEIHGRVEILKKYSFAGKAFFFEFGSWIGRILSYLMPAPGSQNHVANHIPSMFSTVQGRSWGVASMVAECSKIGA
jgi:hypothetical protein